MLSFSQLCKTVPVKYNLYNILLRSLSTYKDNSTSHYDIVIAGGGMVGTTLAATLGQNTKLSGKKILLLESMPDTPYNLPEKYSNRVVSLNPGTRKLLHSIGVWQHIENARYSTVKRLQVMDAISATSITLGEEKSSEDVSYIVENNLLLDSAKKQIKTTDVDVLYESKVQHYCLPGMDDAHVKVQLENGTTYTCDLLIGCDGVNSKVRNAMGITYLNWKYDNSGVVATLTFAEEFDNVIAWQRFLPTGPIAILPLTCTQSSLVWSTTPKEAKRLLTLTNEEFVDAVNEALWKVYKSNRIVDQAVKALDNLFRAANCPADVDRRYPPKITCIDEGSRAAFPYGFGHATSYIGKGVALVGDAAHRVHPLAGQGVNLGFGDIVCLNRVLGDAIYSGSSLGNVSYLKDYETERQRYNVSIMVAIEGLYRLYNTEFSPIVLLRSLGLQTADVLHPVKRMIINHAAA